jgi:integrase/recombinase XerD
MKQEIEAFLNYLSVEKGASSNTIFAYRNDLYQLADFIQRRKGKQDSAPKWVKGDRHLLSSSALEIKGRGYAPATMARKLSAVKSFFRFLIAEGVIKSFPIEDLESPRVGKLMPHPLSVAQVQEVLKQPEKYPTPEGKRDKTMLELLYSTGMQVSELLSLNLGDVNLDKRYVHCPGRGSKERIIPIQQETTQSLRRYLEEARPQLLSDKNEQALLLNRFGGRLTRQGLWQILRAYGKLANLEIKVTPRVLHYSSAARMANKGAAPQPLQQVGTH